MEQVAHTDQDNKYLLSNQGVTDHAVIPRDVSPTFRAQWCPFTERRDFRHRKLLVR